MKKIVCVLLMLVLVFSFAACDEESAPKKETAGKGEQTQQEAPKQETFGLGETAVFQKMKITANEQQLSTGEEFLQPAEGKVFFAVNFTMENTSDEQISASSLLMYEAYVDDVKCEYSFSASACFGEGTLDGSIDSGKKLVGWYALEVPEDWKKVEIKVKENIVSTNAAIFVFENK